MEGSSCATIISAEPVRRLRPQSSPKPPTGATHALNAAARTRKRLNRPNFRGGLYRLEGDRVMGENHRGQRRPHELRDTVVRLMRSVPSAAQAPEYDNAFAESIIGPAKPSSSLVTCLGPRRRGRAVDHRLGRAVDHRLGRPLEHPRPAATWRWRIIGRPIIPAYR
jgi:hypothetical protein